MAEEQTVQFGPYRLDPANARLWQGTQPLRLTPKAFQVLCYLAERPEQLVSKDELFEHVWAETVVSEATLTSAIQEIRKALQDNAREPRYIETVPRRGYRFIAPLSTLPSQIPLPHETEHRQGEAAERNVTRKLAALLSADVQGYSRLMGQDEVGTIRTLTTYRALMAECIAQYGGRVVDAPGDNLLAEFASAVAAVQCAVVIQQTLGAKNAALPAAQQLAFRMGLNVGDVIVEGDRLYGDGVNIAARLEGLAEGGGLCISGTVYDQVKSKVALGYEYLGEQQVKNIAEPVRVYRVQWEAEEGTESTAASLEARRQDSGGRREEELQTSLQPEASGHFHPVPLLIGRDLELAQLQGWLATALNGQRQIVFVMGEAGIGKTTLVDAFLRGIGHGELDVGSFPLSSPNPKAQMPVPGVWVGYGQCIERCGAGEPYMPLLEALGRLCREPGGDRLITLLNQHASTWLVQLPTLLTASELETLQRKVQGATRERMLREMTEAIDAITAERPLVLWLEDLHWSDVSTLELLALLARRREPARLLVIGTYRPVEMLSEGHPLKRVTQELFAHSLGKELQVKSLNEVEVTTYLTRRFPESVLPTRLGQVLYRRTGGNPLFLTSMVQDLLSQEMLATGADSRWEFHRTVEEITTRMPETARQMLARQRERLATADQRLLEAASLAGLEFSTATVAAALAAEVTQVEVQCGRLAEQQQFLRPAGISEWPDGTRAARYGFLHAVYQEFWHERVQVGQQQQWHLRMGERQEAAYGQRTKEIAAELALHFAEGRDYRRAVRYLQQAAETAIQRSAHQEAIAHLTKGLELLQTLPDMPERTQQELALQITLGEPLMAVKGYAAQDVEKTYNRVLMLCQQVGESPELFPVLWGLWAFHHIRAELQTAREVAEQFLRLAESVQDSVRILEAHYMLGETLYFLGELVPARVHLEQEVVLSDPHKRHHVQDPGIARLFFAAQALWQLGYPDQAFKKGREALTLAQELDNPFTLALALNDSAVLHLFDRDAQMLQKQAEALIALSMEQGFSFRAALGIIWRGWALSEQGREEEGVAQIQQGLAAWRATGAELGLSTFLALLAAAYARVGRIEEGLTLIEQALAVVDKTGECIGEAALYVLKGWLLLARPKENHAETEACFLHAIETARHQQAKMWELRATVSLARLWQQQGRRSEAHKMLSEIYNWFTEGFDTKDLHEAKILLEKLGQ